MHFEIQIFYRLLLLAFLHNFFYFVLLVFLICLYLAFFYIAYLTITSFMVLPPLFWIQLLLVILLFDSCLWVYNSKNSPSHKIPSLIKGISYMIMSIFALFLANLLLAWQRMAFIGYQKGYYGACILKLLEEKKGRRAITEITQKLWELEKKGLKTSKEEENSALKEMTKRLLTTLKALKNLGVIEYNWIVDEESPLLAVELTSRGKELIYSHKEKT